MNSKSELRAEAKASRSRLALEVGPIGDKLAGKALAQVPFSLGASACAYAPMGDEADPMPLLLSLAARGHPTGLPVTPRGRVPLEFRLWQPGEQRAPGQLGILEPMPSTPIFEPDILLVPLLAFDRTGQRLGYGAGYYDRTLRALRAKKPILAIGIAYAGQEVDALPADPHDEKLDWVVTEREARRFG